MKQKIFISLAILAAFGLGLLTKRPDSSTQLSNPTPPAGTVPPASTGPTKRPDHDRAPGKTEGPSVPVPDPTPEEIMAANTGQPLAARSFKELTPEQIKILGEAMERLKDPKIGEEDVLKILELAADNYGKQILEICAAALEHPSERVKVRALKFLQRNGDPEILPIAEKALKDTNQNVVISAVKALEHQRGPKVKEIYKSLTVGNDKVVAVAAVDAAAALPAAEAAEVMNEAVASPHQDAAVYAITTMAGMSNKEIVAPLIRGMRSTDETVRANAEHIFFTLLQEIPPAAEAETWWNNNKQNFDENLSPIIDGQPNEPIPAELMPNLPGVPNLPPAPVK